MKIFMKKTLFSKIRSVQVFYLHMNYLYSEGHKKLAVRSFFTAKWKKSSKMQFSIGNPTISKTKQNHQIRLLAPRDRWVHKSIIFDNKKSNFSIKNLNHSITTLLVFVSNALEPYFCLGKNQRSKFAKFILKLTLQKNIFSCFRRQFQYNRKSHSKIHAFSSNY